MLMKNQSIENIHDDRMILDVQAKERCINEEAVANNLLLLLLNTLRTADNPLNVMIVICLLS
jgi:hypothetical protein